MYLDLVYESGRAIEIGPDGWRVRRSLASALPATSRPPPVPHPEAGWIHIELLTP